MDLRSAFKRAFSYLFRADLALSDPKAWDPSLWRLRGSVDVSGENVTEETALTYSAVWNAVNLISGTVASLPLHLMRKSAKKKILADGKKLYWVLDSQANPYMSAMTFRETMMAHILTWGNGFAEIVRNGINEVIQLWPIAPNRVKILDDGGVIRYQIQVGNQKVILPRERVLHIPGLGFDGFQGYSPIAMARKSIGLGMAMETFGSLYFGQGTHPGLVVSHPGKLSQAAHDNLKKSLTDGYSGLGQSHRLLLLEEGMKPEKLLIPPDESQFLESRSFQIPEIARWFNLPPHKLKDLSRSSLNNIEAEQISFVTDSILPWLIRLEQAYNMQLLSIGEQNQGSLYFKHIVEGLLRGDADSRGKFYQQLWQIGAMSINEIREKEDMDPITGGDEYFVPMNYVPLSRALEPPEPVESPSPVPGNGNGNGEEEGEDEVVMQ